MQDMWNLMTQGRAWTNVFDGDKVLSDDSGRSRDTTVLHGIPARSQIGLLTLYEHYKSLEVRPFVEMIALPVSLSLLLSHALHCAADARGLGECG